MGCEGPPSPAACSGSRPLLGGLALRSRRSTVSEQLGIPLVERVLAKSYNPACLNDHETCEDSGFPEVVQRGEVLSGENRVPTLVVVGDGVAVLWW